MLPANPSPRKEKAVRNQRVLDWVEKTVPDCTEGELVLKRKPRSAKRRITQDENENRMSKSAKLIKPDPSQPLSPRKFYVPSKSDSKVLQLPATPESKRSQTSSSICVSPDKLEGILISRRFGTDVHNVVFSDSESLQSTPQKKDGVKTASLKVFTLTCGLDSPESQSKTPKSVSSEKKFSKLGHRLVCKTPLQLYKDSITQNARKLRLGAKRSHNLFKKSPSLAESPEIPCSPTAIHEGLCDRPDQEISAEQKSCDELDKSNNTLVEEPRSSQQKLPLFQRFVESTTDDGKEQLIIDAGQKDVDGATQCSVCRMIYSRGEPSDEALHRQFHSQLTLALKFSGWKKENVAEHGVGYRIIYIDSSDPAHCHKKVQALKAILDQELGFVPELSMLDKGRRLYVYVGDDKLIKGVCLVESITKANRLDGQCASKEFTRANIGVNRLWVYAKHRREGVATRLLDTIRSTYGLGTCVPRSELAFSDPTSHGKNFAARYTGSEHFLVYKPC